MSFAPVKTKAEAVQKALKDRFNIESVIEAVDQENEISIERRLTPMRQQRPSR
jgi:hypothetical protein